MLSAFRHVDPQLHPVHPTARAQQDFVRRFIVDHAAAGAHPLHLAWPHRADVAEAVLVHRQPFEEQGQSLDTGVRMSRGALGFARPHLDRPEMIQEDEGPNGLKGGRWDGATNLEAISFKGMEGGMERRDIALARECEGIHGRSRLNHSESDSPLPHFRKYG